MDTGKKIEELYQLIEGIEIAMLTTRRKDGQLVSRPMATQAAAPGADLWFVTDLSTHKMEELRFDPHINLAYYDNRSREWVSVSGTAVLSFDRQIIRQLYRPDWRTWFAGEGESAGTAEDPRIALIVVSVESVTYMKNDKSRPVVLFELVKGLVSHDMPDIGEVRRISKKELSGA